MGDTLPATVDVGLAGATGYLGQELLRLLAAHPRARLAAVASTRHAGRRIGDVLPQFAGAFDAPVIVPLDDAAFAECDVVLLATPSGVARDLAPGLLEAGARVIDLSGDHRLRDAGAALTHYGAQGAAQAAAEYGLPEARRDRLANAKLVANPGCYPTAASLAALPLLEAGVAAGPVIVDAVSGVTGAGREPQPDLHYPEVSGSARAYKVGAHRHAPEMAQAFADAAGAPVSVAFTPHVVPLNRGLLATVYLTPKGPVLSEGELAELYAKRYADHPFVRVVAHEPDTKHVTGTNWCDVRPHAATQGVYVVTSVIDNLVKGGAGQAVQNLNLLCGFPETTGLPVIGGGP